MKTVASGEPNAKKSRKVTSLTHQVELLAKLGRGEIAGCHWANVLAFMSIERNGVVNQNPRRFHVHPDPDIRGPTFVGSLNSIHWDHTLHRALVLPKQSPWLLGTILDRSSLRNRRLVNLWHAPTFVENFPTYLWFTRRSFVFSRAASTTQF